MYFKLDQKVNLKLFQRMTKIPFTLRHVLASVMVASNLKSIILIFSGTNDSHFFRSSKGGHEGVKRQVT